MSSGCVLLHMCVCVCSHNCIHADEIEKRCRGIYLWYSIVLECVFCVYVHMSPLCRLFFFFDLALVSSHYASTGV